jgi:rifampicin phosphotransferase
MNYLLALADVGPRDRPQVGGKGYALARLAGYGFRVPKTFCLTIGAYHDYLQATGLRERILMELNRKEFKEMRWEEIWDTSLRIRNLFLTTPLPKSLQAELGDFFRRHLADRAVVVRSSAPEEDSAQASFAGLHESFVNVSGLEAILDRVRLVWASLWSDAALLYRQELGLDIEKSSMAVVIQELIVGDCSGVAFSRNPSDESQAVIEAVHGLNQGLVDGVVEPDRWLIDRLTGRLTHFPPSNRPSCYRPDGDTITLLELPAPLVSTPPLSQKQVRQVYDLALQAEKAFGSPQDVEWTCQDGTWFTLQARPITTVATDHQDDQRPWYLSLRRSYENLQVLRQRLENELIPAMTTAAAQLQQQNLSTLDDAALGCEIQRRQEIHAHWVAVYWRDFIPFAHGMRLFGQLYNDALRPADPYEFMNLLGGAPLASLDRNRRLAEMAARVRQNQNLAAAISQNDLGAFDAEFRQVLTEFLDTYGDLSCPITGGQCRQGPEAVLQLVLEMASHPPRAAAVTPTDAAVLTQTFLSRFAGTRRTEAADILDLARASYRLRDDDNIYLGRIEAQKINALQEAHRRLVQRGLPAPADLPESEVIKALLDRQYQPLPPDQTALIREQPQVKARQLIGQPAGPGLAQGPARVITAFQDLTDFKHGEVLVCDAVDPNMTFVVPLAAAVVERRGGMLIHGAIIAREYGLPCVTGVPEATTLIHSGDSLTVDGYLGIVVVD